jgi:hypothetical protein
MKILLFILIPTVSLLAQGDAGDQNDLYTQAQAIFAGHEPSAQKVTALRGLESLAGTTDQHSWLHQHIADIEMKAGRMADAVTDYEVAVSYEDKERGACFGPLVLVLLATNQESVAQGYVTKWLSQWTDDKPLVASAIIKEHDHDYAGALAAWTAAIPLSANPADRWIAVDNQIRFMKTLGRSQADINAQAVGELSSAPIPIATPKYQHAFDQIQLSLLSDADQRTFLQNVLTNLAVVPENVQFIARVRATLNLLP